MNFSPFTTQFTGLPANSSLHQFTTAKFAQNLTTSNGQVVSLLSGSDGNVQFLRSVDGTANFQNQMQPNAPTNISHAQTFILPITMPGEKPGDAQQTVQIQVLNPNQIQAPPKYQNIPMSLPIQGFPQQTVLTVSMPPDSEMLPNHGLPEGVTVLAAIQPQDLQLFAQSQHIQSDGSNIQLNSDGNMNIQTKDENQNPSMNQITIKQEPFWGQNTISAQQATTNDINEFIARQGIPINLQPYLKFDTDNIQIKRDTITADGIVIKQDPSLMEDAKQQIIDSIQDHTHNQTTQQPTQQPLQQMQITSVQTLSQQHQQTDQIQVDENGVKVELDANGKAKKKRKYKKKPPKPKPPKPGQVHIATALDGTILFCCPECQMAYAEKTDLEQHLTVHKIQRRYICDICGAGLKRKEHLERHKLGHSPERPHICSVCKKGFKRKEHLNLHFVIQSGDKTEICGECGKGFYRKDHLRKHTKSHATKRLKEELNAQKAAAAAANKQNNNSNTSNSINVSNVTTIPISNVISTTINTNPIKSEPITTISNTDDILQQIQQQQQQQQQQVLQLQPNDCQTICLQIPTSDNTTVPVQIKLPPLLTTSSSDGTTNTVVLQSTPNSITTTHMNNNFNSQQSLSTGTLLP